MRTRFLVLVVSISVAIIGCGGGPETTLPPIACDAPVEHSGEATYYESADGSGNCGFPPSPHDLMVAAINTPQYEGSAACGMCAHVVGPRGEVTVRIVDRCPECASGDLDLSPEAFMQIAELREGRVPITWTEVPCEVTGPLVYHFKDGSNPWWTAIQIRNHRHRIASVEVREGTQYRALERVDYNYFVDEDGLGPGPYALRVTDIYGSTIEDEGVPSLDDADHPSHAQLPACAD
jgi:expansin (peptidoglycan-binding protein)